MVQLGKTKREQLEELLWRMYGIGNIDGVAIASKDGLLIASAATKNIDMEILSSMSATMFGAAHVAISELRLGACEISTAESDTHILASMGVNPMFLVIAIATKQVNLGLLRAELRKTTDAVKGLL